MSPAAIEKKLATASMSRTDRPMPGSATARAPGSSTAPNTTRPQRARQQGARKRKNAARDGSIKQCWRFKDVHRPYCRHFPCSPEPDGELSLMHLCQD
jgi:hypothetical protein